MEMPMNFRVRGHSAKFVQNMTALNEAINDAETAVIQSNPSEQNYAHLGGDAMADALAEDAEKYKMAIQALYILREFTRAYTLTVRGQVDASE